MVKYIGFQVSTILLVALVTMSLGEQCFDSPCDCINYCFDYFGGTSETTTAMPRPTSCPENFDNLLDDSDYCYRLSETDASIDDGVTFCQSLDNSEIMKIEDAAQNAAILQHVANDLLAGAWILVGLKKTDGSYKWLNDGSELTYTNWSDLASPDQTTNDVAYMNSAGEWLSNPSILTFGKVVCQSPKV